MNVADACTRSVVTASPHTTLIEAAKLMRSEHVGALVVTERGIGGDRPIGILTDRDIVIEAIAVNPEHLPSLRIADLVTRPVVTVSYDWDLDHALETLSSAGIRRAPVIDDDGVLVGILAIDDLLESFAGRFVGFVGVISRELRNEQTTRA